jgi:AraC-like DNA-binding protein
MSNAPTELLKAWFIFSFSLGCWTCLNLLLSQRGDNSVKRTILAFVILLLVPPLNAYMNLISPQPVAWLHTMSQKLTWCYGPLLLMLIHQVNLHTIPRWQYGLQFLPFAVSFAHDIFNWQLISMPIMTYLLFAQVFSYLGIALWLLKQHRARLLKLTSHFKNTSYFWLLFLVASLFALMIYDAGIYIAALVGHLPSTMVLASAACLVAIYVNSIALFSLYQPAVFFHDVPIDDEKPAEAKPGLRNIELSPSAAAALDVQLDALIANHQPHLDENISLPKLAALLGVTTHQLSELLNIHKNTSFYEFLNDLRYQEALRYLETNTEELTIADIAYRSGFNNRNSFYKVFKEKTGQTPLQYKKAIGQ